MAHTSFGITVFMFAQELGNVSVQMELLVTVSRKICPNFPAQRLNVPSVSSSIQVNKIIQLRHYTKIDNIKGGVYHLVIANGENFAS